MAPERLFELRRRTFDTPHFRGIEFIETEAKTILNKVPGNYLPFNWTINAYRGCSHACSFCLSGDTPILMADGSTRPLSEISNGDAIFGTVVEGHDRRYEITKVEAHWQTVKQAFRVSLEDGTDLIASADHRFLSARGWRRVLRAEQGEVGLSPGDRLLGNGSTGAPPVAGAGLPSEEGKSVVAIEPLGSEMPMYDITTGTGDFIANGVVSHNCFARPTHTYLDMNARSDFERKIVVKVNAPELLRKELRAKRWQGETVAMGTNTDPYQRAEGKYRLTRRLIEGLLEVRNPFSILTKGTLILRDLDLLTEAAEIGEVSTAFSIPTLDEDVWRRSEPGTPHPRKRIEAVAKLNAAGVPCGVLVAPLLPGISDGRDQIREVVEAALAAGATFVSPILLHLRPIVKDVYLDWLQENYPDLMPRYEEMYARNAYARPSDRKELKARFEAVLNESGRPRSRPRRRPAPAAARIERARLATQQLELL